MTPFVHFCTYWGLFYEKYCPRENHKLHVLGEILNLKYAYVSKYSTNLGDKNVAALKK